MSKNSKWIGREKIYKTTGGSVEKKSKEKDSKKVVKKDSKKIVKKDSKKAAKKDSKKPVKKGSKKEAKNTNKTLYNFFTNVKGGWAEINNAILKELNTNNFADEPDIYGLNYDWLWLWDEYCPCDSKGGMTGGEYVTRESKINRKNIIKIIQKMMELFAKYNVGLLSGVELTPKHDVLEVTE